LKKFIAIVLALSLAVVLGACSGGNSGGGGGNATSPSGTAAKTIIKFAAQDDSTKATQSVIDAFNASQDKYEAQWVNMTNDSGAMQDQLMTSLKAGSSDYDLLSMDVVWAGQFAAAGYIDPIDNYMQADGLSASEFNAGSMASGNNNAKQYTLPFFPDLGILYFRSDIVSKADATKLTSGDYTWADLLAMAKKYKGQGGTTDGIVFQAKQYEGLICNANEFTNNFKDIAGGLKTMKDFTDSTASPKDILNYDEGKTATSFINGNSVFARNWPYQWGAIADTGKIKQSQVDVAALPDGGSVGGWLLGINSSSKNKDGAWALMKFIATADGQQIMSTKGGYLPGFNATLSDSSVIAANALLSKPGFQKAVSSTIARPVSSDYSKLSDTLQQAIHKYLSGGSDNKTAADAVTQALSAS
jgi:multiple sugar transport system substrate-binding protein